MMIGPFNDEVIMKWRIAREQGSSDCFLWYTIEVFIPYYGYNDENGFWALISHRGHTKVFDSQLEAEEFAIRKFEEAE